MKKEETGIFYSVELIVKAILKGYNFTDDNIYNIVSNKQRQKIIRFCHNQKRTITEIQKHLGLSYNPTWKHVNMLIDKGLVTGTPAIDKTKGAVMHIETLKTDPSFHKKFEETNKKYGHLATK